MDKAVVQTIMQKFHFQYGTMENDSDQDQQNLGAGAGLSFNLDLITEF